MIKYTCTDVDEQPPVAVEIEAVSGQEAAEKFVKQHVGLNEVLEHGDSVSVDVADVGGNVQCFTVGVKHSYTVEHRE